MDKLNRLLLNKNYITIDQLILLTLGKDSSKSKTIDDLRKELDLPRSTLVDHLTKLENDGLIIIKKVNREKGIFPVPEISGKIVQLVEDFIKGYRNIIVHASKVKTKQLESIAS